MLIAHLYPRDAHHRAASALLRVAAGEALIAHSLTLAEVLVGGVRVGRGPEMLADLGSVGVQLAQRPDDEPLRLANLRAATGLRWPDCCALDTALSNAAALATFDQVLASAARQRTVRVVP
ncbi:MAG: type II toxin-antitoxin system VapC family toxin [Actinomycetota bacterium]|nr:type II toxin-antitoxin system VapC family toxin [Actinomycetota bacterium]